MTPTPRTDAVSRSRDEYDSFDGWVDAMEDHARELECENAELRADLKLMEHRVITCGVAASHPDAAVTNTYPAEWQSQQANQVRQLRAELRADKARLDWLERPQEITHYANPFRDVVHRTNSGQHLRAAIDAAMQEIK